MALRSRSFPSSRRREPRAPVMCGALVLWLLGASVLLPGGCSLSTSGLPTPCSTDADCETQADDASPCTDERCVDGECQHVQNGFVPDDHNDCTVDLCEGAASIHDAAKAKGAKCGAQGTLTCDGNGKCGGCKQAEECGQSNECQTWSCDMASSTCEAQNGSPGKPITDPTPGDCKGRVCDGNGGITDKVDISGTPCSVDGGRVCDNMGHCVECLSNSDCTEGDKPSCNLTTHTCGSCDDGVQNGTETGVDCGGTCGGCLGEGCKINGSCASGFCADGVCCEGACSGVCQACDATGKCGGVAPGSSDADTCPGPAKACDGAGACKTTNGGACASDGECVSGACARGLCRLPVNAPCSDRVTCASYLCASGSCKACSGDADCAPSKCVNSTCLSFLGSPCTADSDCINGKCRAGLCRGDLGDACSVDLQCVSQHCSMGQCSPCASPSECSTSACEDIGGVFTCLLKVPDYCSDNAQCVTHNCAGFPGQCK